MKSKVIETGVAEESLASSRPAKRQRQTRAQALAAADLTSDANPQKTHSNVDSSQQPDVTDSSGLPPPAATTVDVTQAARILVGPHSPAPPVAEASIETGQPASKRQRGTRAKVPHPMLKDDLFIEDRVSGPLLEDTEEGHYVFNVGDNLSPRFKIMRKFGEGTFGRVVECWDRRRSDYVAIKIIRNLQKYRDAAMIELQVLATLAANDPQYSRPIVRLFEWFNYRGHVCMVFERLGPSIYDCLRRNSYRGFPLSMAREFLRQILEAVAYMHSLSMVHTDLKPENILFLNDTVITLPAVPGSKLGRRLPPRADVRLIDFGSAAFDEDYHSSIVCTRHYRAPEIVLGVGWSQPCDLWSLGCIMVELITGDALFQTHENLEHLAMIQAAIGPMPKQLIKDAIATKSSTVRALFKRGPKLNWPEGAGTRSHRAVAGIKPLKEHLEAHADESIRPHLESVVDLISKMMTWNPEERCTAQEALQHPFFSADIKCPLPAI